MKAEELRLGNLIHWESKNGVTPPQDIPINWPMLGNLVLQNNFCEDYSPIPLTEEWLEKFGFNKDRDYYSLYHHGDGLSLWWYPERHSVMLHKCSPANVNYKYVHQLQNLYFSLTGEQLTIK